MERVNLNLPEDARKRLKELARRARVPEGELARRMILHCIADAEREEIRQALATRSQARRRRDAQIAAALERLRG